MGDGNRVTVRYWEETDWGVLTGNPQFTDLRMSSESLKGSKQTEVSEEIRSDRQIPDIIRTGIAAEGDTDFELSMVTYQDFFLALFMSAAFSAAVEIESANIDAAIADNSYNDNGGSYLHTASLAITTNDTITRDGGSWIADGFRNGMVVTAVNSEDAGNDGPHTVTALSALVMTIGAAGLVDNAADTTMDLSNAGGFVTDGFVANQWMRVAGFTLAANNVYSKIVSVAAAKIIVEGNILALEALGDTVTLEMGAQIVNGVADTSFSFERENEDLSNVFMQYLGMMPTAFTLDIPVDGRITGSFSWMGKQEQSSAATEGDGSPVAVNDNPVVSSANDIQFIDIDFASICLMSGTIEITNNLREIRCAGELALNGVGIGRFAVTGDLELLFTTLTEKDKYIAHNASGFALAIEDSETTGTRGQGNGMILEVPSYQMVDDETVTPGVDTEVVEAVSIEARMDPTEQITARLTIFPAA